MKLLWLCNMVPGKVKEAVSGGSTGGGGGSSSGGGSVSVPTVPTTPAKPEAPAFIPPKKPSRQKPGIRQ